MSEDAPAAAPALILGDRSRAFRRELGSLAWSVLEDVATDASSGVAATNARRVAANLGIGKDAAARALARLVDARLLVRVEQSRGGGRFGPGRYELRLPPGLLVPCPVIVDTGGDQADRLAVGRSKAGRLRGRQGPRVDVSPRSAAPSLDRPSRRTGRAPAAADGQLELFAAACDDDESAVNSKSVDSQNHGTNQLLRNRQLTAQSLVNQSPRPLDPAFTNQAARQLTRLHRGCDDGATDASRDVSGRVPGTSPQPPKDRTC